MKKIDITSRPVVSDLGLAIWEKPKKKEGRLAFCLDNRRLTSLVGCPVIVDHALLVNDNALISLVGSPKIVKGDFNAAGNAIPSLEGCPEVVEGDLILVRNQLYSLSGIPNKIGGAINMSKTSLPSLSGINKMKEMNGYVFVRWTPITSHILGVFLIKGCKGILTFDDNKFGKAVEIVNRHISKGRSGLLPCQKELIEAGLADFAQI
jgi:hypothetical protein